MSSGIKKDSSSSVSGTGSGENLKKQGISFFTSIQETWAHFKATITGLAKKATAKNEKEATEADMLTAKQQVEATDAAEAKKKQLGISS